MSMGLAQNFAGTGTKVVAGLALGAAGLDAIRPGWLSGLFGGCNDGYGRGGYCGHGGNRECEENINLKLKLAEKDALIADMALKSQFDDYKREADIKLASQAKDIKLLKGFFQVLPTVITTAVPLDTVDP